MIYIGNQTSCWSTTPTEPFEYAVANGFDAFEWFPDKKPEAGWDENDLDKAQRRNIRDVALERGLRLSVHARWQANPLQAEARAILSMDIELAKDLGAALLNIHLYAENGIIGYLEAITPLIRETADAGLQLSIENTPHHAPADFNELFARLCEQKFIPTGHVGMCLDLGHANLAAATRNDYLRFVDQLSPRVIINHLHLHENWGDADTHLPLFTGPAGRDDSGIRGFLRRMRERGFSGSIIFEQWPHPPSLLNNARDKLAQLLKLSDQFPGVRPSSGAATSEASKATVTTPDRARSSGRSVRAASEAHESPNTSLVPHAAVGDRPRSAVPEDGRTPGIKPSWGFTKGLVNADQNARSWREKLDGIRGLLVQQKEPFKKDQLVDLAIYLRFLSTGQIACIEDGRHFRPGHHAGIALDIQKRLREDLSPEGLFLLRKILPLLPSSAEVFRRAEPLTRIRDIAHRNDIPSELKREIKQSLQNKLHRCAGPEDLATSARLLERITAPGANYSAAFVEQFKIFHEELKEFFNASSLEERLKGLLAKADPEQIKWIQKFLELKGEQAPERLNMFEVLTMLRRSLVKAIQRNPAETQEFLLADIALEDFAFVLLSEILNELDDGTGEVIAPTTKRQKGSKKEAAAPLIDWRSSLKLCSQIIHNLELSHVVPEECHALSAELEAWRKDLDSNAREDLLRVKASLERGRRLAEDFSDSILALFPERVQSLGQALGVPERAVRIYGEAEVRAHLVFQLSKLISLLLHRIRERLALPAWDVVVTGCAIGRMRAVENLTGGGLKISEPVIALVKEAEGDEEIPKGIAGIILAHGVPHLSHLGVRARQAGVVFAASEEVSAFASLSAFDGQIMELRATPERVEWKAADNAKGIQPEIRHSTPHVLEVRLNSGRQWIPVKEATLATAGAKADGVRQLFELSRQERTGFSVPGALVVPFGVMEAALASDAILYKKYQDSIRGTDATSTENLPAIAESIRDLMGQIRVPEAIASAVEKEFSKDSRLMVRSSANCEDLEEMSGAGLYESVANVVPNNVADSVLAVWASLWTRRAVISRRAAGIPQGKAHMAVLIQQMIEPDYSFVLHTRNPINQNPREVYAEIAVGLGETLVSASSRGTPYRMVCDKESGSTTILAFANFSRALCGGPNGKVQKTVDYSSIALSRDAEARRRLGERLAKVGRFVENAFKKPQDVEGAVQGDKIYLVQSRPQQGLRGA